MTTPPFITGRPIAVRTTAIAALGANAAIVLQQLFYVGHEAPDARVVDEGWVTRPLSEWADLTGLSTDQLSRTFAVLVRDGWAETRDAEARLKGWRVHPMHVADSRHLVADSRRDVADSRHAPLLLESQESSRSQAVAQPTSLRSSSKRATRIPEPFEITDDMLRWARAKTPNFDVRAETENFVDYWLAAPGAKGVKQDWAATWRGWMRRQFEQSGHKPRRQVER